MLPVAFVLGLLAHETPKRLADRVEVLFLGDRGHHEPESRADLVAPAFARVGIDVWFRADLAALDPARLRHVDVVLVYANHDEIGPAQEKALMDFVEGGGGLVAVHCASYCFRNSERYVALVGGQFDHHGTGEFTARMLAESRDHPALGGVSEFATWDETYVHRALTADRLVLQVRDEGGRAEPVTWVREQGPGPRKGRVYYTALGHDQRTWAQPAFQAQLAQAIRWAAGRPDFTIEPPKLTFSDAKLPNYTPGAQWGTEGAPISKLQDPLSPKDERRTMQLPPGFDARLFASEPDVVKPIALSFDARGRLWILESVDYPNDKVEKLPASAVASGAGNDAAAPRGHDRVKILEDKDGDGRVDANEIKLFVDGLNVATGLVCTDDGCIVAQAPDMLRFVDKDGDDRADERTLLFTGFGEGDTHAGPSNLRWGDRLGSPDGWIWGTVGYSAFRGKVGGKNGAPVVDHSFGQAVFRFRPDGSRLERVAPTTNNTWGLSFDEQGEIFVSTANGDHLVHVAVPSPAIESVFGLDSRLGDGTVHVPDHDRLHALTELRQVDYHGGFTAAAGCAIYTDRLFPREYWNRCSFVCEPTGHLVHQCFLEPNPTSGSTFVARDGRNLLSSWDEWCAPIAAEVGPDGAVWVLDWYSPVVQHNPTPRGFTTGKGNAYETPHRDNKHGRVWRIVWTDAESREPSDVALTAQARRSAHELDDVPARVDRQHDAAEAEHGHILADVAAVEQLERSLAHVDDAERAAMGDVDEWLDFDTRIPAALDSSDRPRALAATIVLAQAWKRSLPKLLDPKLLPSSDEPGEPATTAAATRPLLSNAAFDPTNDKDGTPPREWRFVQYGGAAAGAWSDAGRAASGSAQLTSQQGADASLSQTVAVQRHGRYRLSGWIKTDAVTPLGDAYGALFNVHELQNPRVVTPAVTGTHDWTRVEVEFDSGDHEAFTINALLGGWGRARGTAWFDDVVVEVVAAGSPAAELVGIVATHAAHTDPASALDLVASRLEPADPALARAALEGLVRGWPRDGAPKIELDGATAEASQRAAAKLDVAGRAALLLLAEKLGRLDLFPDEGSRVRGELAAKVAENAAPPSDRVDAARRFLALAPASDAVPLVVAQISALAPPELVNGLLLALGESGDSEVGAAVAKRVPQLSAATLPTAVELLLRRPAWTRELLAQLIAGRLDPKALAPDVIDRLRRSGDADVASLAEQVARSLGRGRDADRAQVVEAFVARLAASDAPRGDVKRGAELFAAQCAKCHTLRGQGGPVGPDLTAIGKRGRADLLVEILDPNRSVEGTWRAWEVTTKSGDELTGRLVNEGRATIELVDAAAARHVIARDDLVELRPLARSLMPEGFETLGEADVIAIIEYLVQDAAAEKSGGG